jgi:hypothetical protein
MAGLAIDVSRASLADMMLRANGTERLN